MGRVHSENNHMSKEFYARLAAIQENL
ncbi:TPA: recombinase, partial [Escherichia coli]|nr:recombinase [Escherichia coli]